MILLATTPGGTSEHDTLNPGVWDPGTTPYGQTYSDWADNWWNWGFHEPAATNPILDESGAQADRNQSGPVFNLAGNFGGTVVRRVHKDTIAGKALFFPIVNAAWWADDDLRIDPGSTHEEKEADLRAQANDSADAVSVLAVSIDGVALTNLFDYRAESGPGGFVLHVPEGSLLTDFGAPAGDRDPTVSDGFWLMLDPLEPGRHVMNFRGVIGDPGSPDFSLDVTYEIIPEPSSVALLLMGAVGLIGWGSYRRRRA